MSDVKRGGMLYVQVVTSQGIPVTRDFLAEVARRTEEHMSLNANLTVRVALGEAIDECVEELETYARSLGPEHKEEKK